MYVNDTVGSIFILSFYIVILHVLDEFESGKFMQIRHTANKKINRAVQNRISNYKRYRYR